MLALFITFTSIIAQYKKKDEQKDELIVRKNIKSSNKRNEDENHVIQINNKIINK